LNEKLKGVYIALTSMSTIFRTYFYESGAGTIKAGAGSVEAIDKLMRKA
jgi:hypothetical protein